MTSMFDQHEASLGRAAVVSAPTPALTSSGYVSVQLEPPAPLFSKQCMKFNPSGIITHMAVANDHLALAMNNNMLFRIDLKNPDRHEVITISKYTQADVKLIGLFMDPLGCHILLSFAAMSSSSNPELHYLHRKSTKLKPVKSKTHIITAVGWNLENTSEATTGAILLGTSKGRLLETEIGHDGDKMFQSSIEQYWRQVFDIGKDSNIPITGIEFYKAENSHSYFIFVAMPERLYEFNGEANPDDKPLLQPIFNSYLNVPETSFQQIVSSFDYSKLQFFYERKKKNPSFLGWLTEAGIYCRQLDDEDENSSLTKGLLNFPSVSKKSELQVPEKSPLSFVLTEFHALILYEDHVKAICLLNNELVYEDYFSESLGKLIDIVKDPTKQTVWVITENAVFRYKVTREERNIWQIYADKNMFTLAKKYCENNPAHIDKINNKEAEVLFEAGNFEQSAAIYAKTQSRFEAICLKFLKSEKVDALKLFLQIKLETLDVEKDKLQTTMLVMWVVEFFLSQINQAKNSDQIRYRNLQEEFQAFLSTPKVNNCVVTNKTVIYDLMASHGDKENLHKFTITNKDYENVIRQNIYKKAYFDALTILNVQDKRELFYKFTPRLMQEIPKETVDVLIKRGKQLSTARLLPTLISCDMDTKHMTQMIRYLKHCVEVLGCTEPAIHNYLLSLYVAHDPDALNAYITSQGQTASMVNYDIHYALRLCREKNLTIACVQLSSLLGLWETAVKLALDTSVTLAKKIADMPDDIELKKKLRLEIAKFVIKGKQDIQQAMEFLQESDLIKIEDILTYFSDHMTIDHFREPICNSLREYNQQMQEQREEMEEATKAAELVRGEIQTFRNSCTVLNLSDTCVLCNITLLLRPSYLFPCGHKFHSDCLVEELQPLLGPAKKNQLAELQRQLAGHFPEGKEMWRSKLTNEMDSLLSSQCLYCGEHMIQAIDTPFIPDADWVRVMKEWE